MTYSKTKLKAMDRVDLVSAYETVTGREAAEGKSRNVLIDEIIQHQRIFIEQPAAVEEPVVSEDWSEAAEDMAVADEESGDETLVEEIDLDEELLDAAVIESLDAVVEAPKVRAPRGSKGGQLVNDMTMTEYRWLRKVVGKTPNRIVHDSATAYIKEMGAKDVDIADVVNAALTLASVDEQSTKAAELCRRWWNAISSMARSRLVKDILKSAAS